MLTTNQLQNDVNCGIATKRNFLSRTCLAIGSTLMSSLQQAIIRREMNLMRDGKQTDEMQVWRFSDLFPNSDHSQWEN